ncbi:MAG: Smr/MutS family protein [Nitrospiraceae bacterium]|nr:Smr/MutS family protein [Nitrospiraceae bacterium]
MSATGGKTRDFHNRPFDKLKKKLEQAKPAPQILPPPPPPTDEDLFENAMSDVLEIPEFRFLPCAHGMRRSAPSRERHDPDIDALSLLEQIAAGKEPINLSDTQEYIEWTNPAVSEDLTKDLHAGKFSVQGMIDLHGFTGDAVNEELDVFLAEAFTRRWRCVKIIHGRGLRSVRGPVLKDAVVKRLLGRYRASIIAFVSARQCDGGLGALYVLLGLK